MKKRDLIEIIYDMFKKLSKEDKETILNKMQELGDFVVHDIFTVKNKGTNEKIYEDLFHLLITREIDKESLKEVYSTYGK